MYLCEVANKYRKHLLAPLLYKRTDIKGGMIMADRNNGEVTFTVHEILGVLKERADG